MQIDRAGMGLAIGPESVDCPYGAAVIPGDYLISPANASQINTPLGEFAGGIELFSIFAPQELSL